MCKRSRKKGNPGFSGCLQKPQWPFNTWVMARVHLMANGDPTSSLCQYLAQNKAFLKK